MIQYLTGASNPTIRARARELNVALLIQPGTAGYVSQLSSYPAWAADNGCYAKGDKFDVNAYLAWLDSIPAELRPSCLFATAPDVVGNMAATWERCKNVLPQIRAMGYPVAIVAQNGLRISGPGGKLEITTDERLDGPILDVIDWHAFDVLFIGGDDRFKLSWRQHFLIEECHRNGKRVHMGRVNSAARLQRAEWLGCDTADGTFLSYAGREGQDKAVSRLAAWFPNLFTMHVGG